MAHFRTESLRHLGGWDAWNVTEDADLAFRLMRGGYSMRLIDSVTIEEAPVTLKNWMNQRRRWLKGWMQTLIVHTRAQILLRSPRGYFAASNVFLTLIATVLTTLIAPAVPLFLVWLGYGIYAEGWQWIETEPLIWLSIAVGILGIVSILWTAVLGIMRRGPRSLFKDVALLPLYYCLMSVAAWLAIGDLIRQPHKWLKTHHLGQNGRDAGRARRR